MSEPLTNVLVRCEQEPQSKSWVVKARWLDPQRCEATGEGVSISNALRHLADVLEERGVGTYSHEASP